MSAGNGGAWVWILGVMPGIGDVAMQVRPGIVDGTTPNKLPEEFDARRLSRLMPESLGPGKAQLHIVPWLGHTFKIVREGVIRVRGLLLYSQATGEFAEEAEKIWNPPAVELPRPRPVIVPPGHARN